MRHAKFYVLNRVVRVWKCDKLSCKCNNNVRWEAMFPVFVVYIVGDWWRMIKGRKKCMDMRHSWEISIENFLLPINTTIAGNVILTLSENVCHEGWNNYVMLFEEGERRRKGIISQDIVYSLYITLYILVWNIDWLFIKV